MTAGEVLHITSPPIVVLGVQPGDPPFRVVQIDGELAGEAASVVNVLEMAHGAGL
jgi:hypothetical protein